MFYSKILSFLIILLLSFALVLPALALDDPPGKGSKNKISKPANSAKSTPSKPTPSKKPAKQTKKDRKNKQNVKDAKDISAEKSSRDIWIERAKGSGMLTGIASWYGGKNHGGATASGINYDMYTFTAAHRTLPIGTVVKVTDHLYGRSVIVCITDRGPYTRGRIIDLSYAAAKQINLSSRGIGKVDVEIVSDENGTPLTTDKAWFVRYKVDSHKSKENVGPFRVFADAAAMHEALLQAHPEAEVVMENVDD